jgi:hypothetical protein
MKGWAQLSPKVSVDCQLITLPNFQLQMDWKKGPLSWVRGEVVLRERTVPYYAYQHLLSGYPLQRNSLDAMTSCARAYHKIAKDNVPEIKAWLTTEVQKRMRLSSTITDYLGDSYNLNLLCAVIIEHVLFNTSLSSLNASNYTPTVHDDFWELHVDERPDQILSRTRDKTDADRLRESVIALLNDTKMKGYLGAMKNHFIEFDKTLATFRMGMNDITYAVELGRTIEGECDVCEQYA